MFERPRLMTALWITLAACGGPEDDPLTETLSEGFGDRNGLNDDGLHGLTASSRLRTSTGHSTLRPISFGFNSSGVATLADAAGIEDWWEWARDPYRPWLRHELLRYIAKCALPDGKFLRVPNPGSPITYTNFPGRIGLFGSTSWFEGSTLSYSNRLWLSACLLSQLNANGVSIDIELVAPPGSPINPALTTPPSFAFQEAAFYGDLFSSGAPDELGCGGYINAAGYQPGWYPLNRFSRACDSGEGDIDDGHPCDGVTPDIHADSEAICKTACGPGSAHGGVQTAYTDCGPHNVTQVITVYVNRPGDLQLVTEVEFDDCWDGVRFRRCGVAIQ